MQPTGVGGPPPGGGSPARITGGNDGRERLTAALSDGLALRFGYEPGENEQLAQDAEQFQFGSIMDLAQRHLSMLGVQVGTMSRSEMARAVLDPSRLASYGVGDVALSHSTGDFPSILKDALNKRMRQGYEQTPRTWDVWAARTTAPDFKEIKRPILGGVPVPPQVQENAEYTYTTLGEAEETYVLLKHGFLISFSWEMLVNDDMNAFTRQALNFVGAARRLEDDLVYKQITDNPTMNETGRSLFNTTDNTLASSGSAPSLSAISARRQAMAKQRGIAPDSQTKGALLNIRARYMLVPTALADTTRQLIASTVDPSKNNRTPNFEAVQQLTPVEEPRLDADSAAAWYLAASPNQVDTVELAFLEGEPAPFIDEWEGKKVDGRTFKLRHTCAAKAIDYRGLQKDPGA
jgi:hypothetical protein